MLAFRQYVKRPVKNNGGQTIMKHIRAQELCESRGGRPGLLSLISLRFLCGRQATLSQNGTQTSLFARGPRKQRTLPNKTTDTETSAAKAEYDSITGRAW